MSSCQADQNIAFDTKAITLLAACRHLVLFNREHVNTGMRDQEAHTYRNTLRPPAVQRTCRNRSCIFNEGDQNSVGSLLTDLLTRHGTGETADEELQAATVIRVNINTI